MRARILLTSAALAAVAMADIAHAQDAADETVAESDDAIVVTAQRRAQSKQDVGIALAAYGGEELRAMNVSSSTDVARLTPGVHISGNVGGQMSQFTIRGVTQNDFNDAIEAPVAVYVDDVYLSRIRGNQLDLLDVERVEVLRGPQGTLYGRNTIGGAVKYVTRALNPDSPELRIRGTLGTYKQADLVVTASAPISDIVRVGGSVARLSRGGFGDNLTIPGLENYNKDVWAGRGTVELGGNGAPVLIRISGDYTRDKSDPRNGHRLIPGLVSGAPVLDDVYDTRAGLVDPEQDIEAWGLAMNVSAELSDNLTLR